MRDKGHLGIYAYQAYFGRFGVLAPLTSTHRKALRIQASTSKRSATKLTYASYAKQLYVYVYLTEVY